jgi:hypothetical protein
MRNGYHERGERYLHAVDGGRTLGPGWALVTPANWTMYWTAYRTVHRPANWTVYRPAAAAARTLAKRGHGSGNGNLFFNESWH